jgi:hypothetical protein
MLAPQGRFTTQRQSPVGRPRTFRPKGAARLQRSSRWRRIPVPLPKRIAVCGISLHATMRQGVDQPCRIRGSESRGCGPALPWRWDWRLEEEDSGLGGGAGPRPGASLTTPLPSPRWRGLSSNLRQRRVAMAAAAVGAAACTVWDGEARQVAGCGCSAGRMRSADPYGRYWLKTSGRITSGPISRSVDAATAW